MVQLNRGVRRNLSRSARQVPLGFERASLDSNEPAWIQTREFNQSPVMPTTLRFVLPFALALASPSTLWAQNRSIKPLPITSPIKDAGVYHMATNTWTRKSDLVALTGPSQLYDNTCTVGTYAGLSAGQSVVDSGRIPSTSSGGLADCYEVTCFSMGYCTITPGVANIDTVFVDSYAACGNFAAATVAVAFTLNNLPGGLPGGGQACWIVTFNLTNTTFTFNLGGDADGLFDDDPDLDHFGWTWGQSVPGVGGGSGPILAGDPLGQFNMSCGLVDPAGQGGGVWTGFNSAGQGAGTDHAGWGFATGPGTGIGTEIDQYVLGGLTGCFWFGGYGAGLNPLSSFYLKLWGQAGPNTSSCAGNNSGSAYCFSTTGNCPSAAVGLAGRGCPHNAGPNGAGGASLLPVGNAQFSNDTYGFYLSAGPASLGIMIQGAMPIAFPNGNNTVPDSAGLLCVAPQQRGGVELTNLGPAADEALITSFQGQPFGATAQPPGQSTYNQFWFRDAGNPNANPGSGAEFNFSNAVQTDWIP